VEFALSWMDGGEQATELLNHVNYDGAFYAGAGIVAGGGILAFNKYLEFRSEQKRLEIH